MGDFEKAAQYDLQTPTASSHVVFHDILSASNGTSLLAVVRTRRRGRRHETVLNKVWRAIQVVDVVEIGYDIWNCLWKLWGVDVLNRGLTLFRSASQYPTTLPLGYSTPLSTDFLSIAAIFLLLICPPTHRHVQHLCLWVRLQALQFHLKQRDLTPDAYLLVYNGLFGGFSRLPPVDGYDVSFDGVF